MKTLIKLLTEVKTHTWLTLAALALWLVSLTLPGFSAEGSRDVWHGGMILLIGLPLGWMLHGWAVYANIFFIYAVIRILLGRKPTLAILCMIVLAATMPFFTGVVENEGNGEWLPIASWGWGAFIWLISLFILTCAALFQTLRLGARSLIVVTLAVFGTLSFISFKHHEQWLKADVPERQLYLSDGLAITRSSFCGEKLIIPTNPVLAAGTVLEEDIDPDLQRHRPWIILPHIPNYHADGYDWVSYSVDNHRSAALTVRYRSAANHPLLQVKRTGNGAVIRILAEDRKNILYEQRLSLKQIEKKSPIYCPMESQEYSNTKARSTGYDKELLHALGESTSKDHVWDASLSSEDASERCSLGPKGLDGIKDLRLWDGRQVIFGNGLLSTGQGFCSKNYILIENLAPYSSAPQKLGYVIEIFDRTTLRPLAVFNGVHECTSLDTCNIFKKEVATGVRVSNSTAVIESPYGGFIANRLNSL